MIAVTNRHLCRGDYLEQIRKITSQKPVALILREKNLSEEAYETLAKQVLAICEAAEVPCFLHSHAEMAKALGCHRLHLSIPALRSLIAADGLDAFDEISVSCHSLEDVREAAAAGAARVLLGNIFETDCKKGLPGKGLEFLKEICSKSPVPVYAIGGISEGNLPQVLESGAAGGCMMSGFMKL